MVVIEEAHINLVRAAATDIQQKLPIHVEWCDLFDAGMTGLVGAAHKYRPDTAFSARGPASFITYAKYRIRGAMLDEIRRFDWASRNTRLRYKQIQAARTQLAIELGRPPDDDELRLKLGITPHNWSKLMATFRAVSATSFGVLDREARSVEPAADQRAAHQELLATLSKFQRCLKPRTQRLLELYYRQGMTMQQIGLLFGVRESRICQLHSAALAKLRERFHRRGVDSASHFFWEGKP
jgi:RNA polymerase sigma factor for flagellar operon FliA